jgi:Na+-translocating ferredoxin:NAD+ oxidoreductase RnfG subunit
LTLLVTLSPHLRDAPTMEETKKRRVLIILFFTALTVLFTAFIYLGYKGPIDPRYRRRLEETVKQYRKEQVKPDTVNVVLSLGQKKRIGNIIVGYRGIDKDALLIDVVILELDPEMTYPHRVSKAGAKGEIRLGGQPFKIISAGNAKIHLRRIIR